MSATTTPRFSPNPEPLPIERRATEALEDRVEHAIGQSAEDAKKTLATILGLTLAGETVKGIAGIVGLKPAQVRFAQRVLRARGELGEQAKRVVEQFATEGVIAAVEGAMHKIQSGDGRFIERMLEESGVWSRPTAGDGTKGGAAGAVNPGLPALQINIALPPGVNPAERQVFGQVLATPKVLDGEKTAT